MAYRQPNSITSLTSPLHQREIAPSVTKYQSGSGEEGMAGGDPDAESGKYKLLPDTGTKTKTVDGKKVELTWRSMSDEFYERTGISTKLGRYE